MKRYQRIAAGGGALAAALLAASCATPDKFDMADTSDDGTVDKAEFSRYMLEAIYTEIDADGDSKITFAESKAANPDATEAKFRAADRNGDGVVTPEEAKRHFKRWGTMEDLFSQIDTNRDGELTEEEVQAYKDKLEKMTGTPIQKLSKSVSS